MPRKTSIRRRQGRRSVNIYGGRRKTRGGSKFTDFFKRAHSWIKKNKVISRVSGALNKIGVPYTDKIASVASTLGYGRRRRGGSLRLAGAGRRR